MRSSSSYAHQRSVRAAGTTPVEYIHRDISKPALVALYRRANVMMVTALRDGMNLVAQEFVLYQSEPGLRVAGAARSCSPSSRARPRFSPVRS